MNPHVQRMKAEYEALHENIKKLGEFIDGNAIFTTLHTTDQALMSQQFVVMQQYANVLYLRIARAEKA